MLKPDSMVSHYFKTTFRYLMENTLLTKEYVQLVGFAFVLAVPLAWLAMDHWLTNFAYRIQVQWWMFLLTGISAVLITILTVGLLAIKAARANPVISLRDD